MVPSKLPLFLHKLQQHLSKLELNQRRQCGAKDQLGHLCHPCLHQDQMAEALLANETPRARQILLRRENHNLRMVRTFTTLEHQAVAGTTQAWRIAVAAKEAERDMLLERRRQNEERHE